MVLVQNWPFFHLFFFLAIIGQENVFYDILERKNAFLGYKNSRFKKWNNCDFCKGVNPWFQSKIGHFSIFCFWAIQARKKCFTILQNEKMLLQVIKTTSLKSRKIEIFAKGLTHGFSPKLAIFPSFVFGQYIFPGNITIFQNEKMHFQVIKTTSLNSRKIESFAKGLSHGFGPKLAIFPFFFRHYRAGKSVLQYSRTKNAFLGYINASSKSGKIEIFSKGLTHGFGLKLAIFFIFFLGNIGQEKVFYDILERKNAFLGYKNNKFKKSKN